MSGNVLIDDRVIHHPGYLYDGSGKIRVRKKPFVSRGGVKLAHALKVFNIIVHQKTALDIGASSGGFTDCLLKQGARKVYTIDVGPSQLHSKLATDSRVIIRDHYNARSLSAGDFKESIDLAVIDVSFITVKKILPTLHGIMSADGIIVSLIKPQFEAPRSHVEKGGLVKDPHVHGAVLNDIIGWCPTIGLRIQGLTFSPIQGRSGNIEYFIAGRFSTQTGPTIDISGIVDRAWRTLAEV